MNESQSKVCQSCHNEFVIEPEDFDFYEKMKVPAPTWCPDCRMIRRMLWRNEGILFKRKCDATGVDVLSILPPDFHCKVYEAAYWRSDAWDPMSYGREYNLSKPFFVQFNELFTEIPHPNLVQKNIVDSKYSFGLNQKNCYLACGADDAEDSAYLFSPILHVKDCFDVHSVNYIEHCYDSVDIEKSDGLRFCQNCIGCSDSWLLYDCRNCTSCFGCVGLRSKNYHIFNKAYSRQDYEKELGKIAPNTYGGLQRAKEKFNELKLQIPRKYASIQKSEHVTGDDIINSKNCIYCFGAKYDSQNCKYCFRLLDSKDGHDAITVWGGAEQFYEAVTTTAQRTIVTYAVWGGFDIQYSYNCYDCNNIFGCVGLRNKSYCILNKQYTKEEYEELVPKIVNHMNEVPYVGDRGRVYKYGEFFPVEFSPYGYNESMAYDFFPKTKDEVLQLSFRWRDLEDKQYTVTKKAGDDFGEATDSAEIILNEVYECEHKGKCNDNCATAFKIIPQELQFLKKMGLPLPRLCFFCRQKERLHLKNPLHLWHRKCMKPGCENEFETPYAPDRPEIVYCEQCYQAEVM